jgi:hypothetical protein
MQQQVQDGMTAAQAIMAIVGPLGVFLAALATAFLKRHFLFLDKLETRLAESGKLDAEIAVELRLAREARERYEQRFVHLEQALGEKIDDQRVSNLTDKVHALTAVAAVQIVAEAEATGPASQGDHESQGRRQRRTLPSSPGAPPASGEATGSGFRRAMRSNPDR